ncbi:MAG: hypothetical protein FJ009_04440 [Chloroflexi bacterium]|nr:hypothetical protein [Chloroflexota bacterium]
MLSVSPKLGELLIRTTQTTDLEAALFKVLTEYVDFKTATLNQTIKELENKWRLPFDEFAQRARTGTLGQDAYSWEVEQDFWKWEQAVTLLKHYQSLRSV